MDEENNFNSDDFSYFRDYEDINEKKLFYENEDENNHYMTDFDQNNINLRNNNVFSYLIKEFHNSIPQQ